MSERREWVRQVDWYRIVAWCVVLAYVVLVWWLVGKVTYGPITDAWHAVFG